MSTTSLRHPAIDEWWYPFSSEEEEALSVAEKILHPLYLIPLLSIIDLQGSIRHLYPLYDEQVAIIQACLSCQNVLVEKPRQIGSTTISNALLFCETYTCPDPIGTIAIAHESKAVGRINQMLRMFGESLPRALRPDWVKDNSECLTMGHNGASFRQAMAGGRGQSRSFTNQKFLGTEVGLWPQGSAVAKGTDVDRQVLASTMATLHEGPHRRVILESTGNGPSGVFYEYVRDKRSDPNWKVLFFEWWRFSIYERAPRDKDLLSPRDDRERQVVAAMVLNKVKEQAVRKKMQWRRDKIADIGFKDFMKEYPEKWDDPFLMTGRSWFDGHRLAALKFNLPLESECPPGLVLFEEYIEGEQYYAGVDTSGGTQNDYAVVQIIHRSGRHVARWSANNLKPKQQVRPMAQLLLAFNALTLVELNNHGKTVYLGLKALGVRLWHTEDGKPFLMMRGASARLSDSKDDVYDHAAHVINQVAVDPLEPDGGLCTIRCPITASEAISLRENERGNLEAPKGMHDDHIDAMALAHWCRRPRRYKVHRPESKGATMPSVTDIMKAYRKGVA